MSSISGTVNGFTNPAFTYDANGNLLTGVGRTLTYTSYNMPASVSGVRYSGGTSYSYTYTYGPEHERVRLAHSTLGTFVYVHPEGKGQLLYEKEIKTGGVVEHKSYINAGNLLIAAIIKRSDGTGDTRYFHQDRLGSVTTITNATGGVMERLAYDAFGKRRNPNGTDDPNNSLFGVNTDRGYTGHEHLDEVALIHMNGRVYDPVIARFTSADPFLQQPDNLQDYNRYSYVNNNPLMYTDPSGYFKLKKFWRPIAAIAVAYFTGYFDWTAIGGASGGGIFGGGGLANAMAGGFAGGLVNGGGDFKAGIQGALTASLFFGVGELGGGVPLHAAAGCVSAAASGGDCGAGALAGGFAEAAAPLTKNLGVIGELAARSIVGGTASAIGGGKFENGAVTAAFGYLFNNAMHGEQESSPGQQGLRKAHDIGLQAASAGEMLTEEAGWFMAGGVAGKALGGIARFFGFARRGFIGTGELNPTHGMTMSRREYAKLVEDIQVNGIKHPIAYVQHGGAKYIVDGHHRVFAARRLGIDRVPAEKVTLPYGGYKTPADLTYTPR